MKSEKIKKGCGIAIIILIILIIGFFLMFKKAFGPDNYSVTIEQKIGGNLVCDVTYSADVQSYYYDIDYKYVSSNGESYDFGKGFYHSIDWNENDQLYKHKNWIILPTGNDFGSIKIIALDLNTAQKKEFEVYPRSIENDSLWKSKNIESLIGWSPSKVEFDTIINNKIITEYTYRVDREKTDILETHKIEFELNENNGILKMKGIEKIK